MPPHAGEELRRAERLRDVVVGADEEPRHEVERLVAVACLHDRPSDAVQQRTDELTESRVVVDDQKRAAVGFQTSSAEEACEASALIHNLSMIARSPMREPSTASAVGAESGDRRLLKTARGTYTRP